MKNLLRFVCAVALLAVALPVTAANPIPDDRKIGGFAIGCQAYSFNRFTLLEAIEKTAQAGGKIIEMYPRQKLSKENPAVFNHDSPEDVIAQVKAHLTKNDVKVVNYGVVAGKDEAEWRRIFEFAKKMGLYAITTEDEKNIDVIEKLVKEFDIRVGYHEHAKKEKDPNYKLWDPNYVAALIKNRDARIGACADTGHWQTSGLDPLDGIKILKGRIVSLHLKDRAARGAGNHDLPYGMGIGRVAEILTELKAQNFSGNISIEYEYNWEHSVPEIAQCIGFVRGWAAGAK